MGDGLSPKTGPTTDGSGTAGPRGPATSPPPPEDLLEDLTEQESDCQPKHLGMARSGSLGPTKVHGAQWRYPDIASVHSLLNFMF